MKKGKSTRNSHAVNHSRQYFYLWLSGIAIFYISILSVSGNFLNGSGFNMLLLLLGILVGVIGFLLFFVSVLRNKDWKMLGVSGGVFVLFFFVLYSIPSADLSKTNTKIDQSDPLIDCPLHEKCGGGTKRMKQSACVNSTCCGGGNVNITLDKDECKLKQQEYAQSNKPAPVTNVRIQQPIQIPTVKPMEAPMCCKENCNSFTGTCTTRCERSWFCN